MFFLTIGKQDSTVKYHKRAAVRCVITKDVQVCIISVEKGNYFKLPGGGVELEDKEHAVTARREALEETGCEVEVGEQLTITREYRGTLQQESFAYICPLIKDTDKVELTEEEKSEGLSHQWCPLAVALEKMKSIEPTSELGQSIKKRDTFILECYREHLGGAAPTITAA